MGSFEHTGLKSPIYQQFFVGILVKPAKEGLFRSRCAEEFRLASFLERRHNAAHEPEVRGDVIWFSTEMIAEFNRSGMFIRPFTQYFARRCRHAQL